MESSVLRNSAARAGLLMLCLSLIPSLLSAQSIKLGSREVQIHGSVQQGVAVTDDNNFLTMETTEGSAEMTDAALNASCQLTRQLRAGAQFYVRNIGELGQGRLEVDWAFADYRFNRAIGVRLGKVKSAMGLYTDTQDMEFLHPWALLPQSIYPLDLRSITIAHVGGDVYGSLPLGRAGTLNYTAFAGLVQHDDNGGYKYGNEDTGVLWREPAKADVAGFDVRWETPIDGLMAGYSFHRPHLSIKVFSLKYNVNVDASIDDWRHQALYGEYVKGPVHLAAEYRAERNDQWYQPTWVPMYKRRVSSWFASGAYRFTDWLQVGGYYSLHVPEANRPSDPDTNHIADRVATARFDVNRYWHVKVEGHFIDGYGFARFPRGFYLRSNPAGFAPNTNMLVLRTGVNF